MAETVQRPYPNEHACRLRDPGDFQEDSFRRTERNHDGKKYSVIMGRLTGEDSLTEQAYRYGKDTWSADEARTHCSGHDGSFEAASEASLLPRVYKTFAAEVKAEGDEARLIRFRITTDAVDRERDVLSPAGWKLDHYLKNPVVLWAHDYRQPPIARAREIVSTEHGLSSLAEFPPRGVHPFADTIYDLLKGGFLNSASVGFNPTKPPVYNEERKGYDYAEQELLEFSVVPVPANPEALVEARAAGIDLQPIKKWAEKVLGPDFAGIYLEKLFERVDRLERQVLHAGVRAEHDECPMGEDCPMKGKAEMDAEDCPMGEKCPMRGKGRVLDGPSERIMLELEDVEADQPVFALEVRDESEGFQVDPEAIRLAVVEAVGTEVTRAFNRLRGRVD